MDYLIEHFHKRIDCSHNTTPPNITLHLHNHFELYLFLSGDCRYFIDGKSIEMQRGYLLFINNNQVHGPKQLSDKVMERFCIHFSPKFADSLSTEKTSLLKAFNEGTSMAQLNEEELTQMTFLMTLLTNEYHNPSYYGHDLQVSSLLTQVLLFATKCADSGKKEITNSHLPELINRMLLFIQENLYSTDLSIEVLAQEFSHSGIYLNRLFKREFGSSIYQYILLSRISAAKRYLENGEDVQSTCLLSGFNDYSNFIRTFKKITGMTPKQYAKSFTVS